TEGAETSQGIFGSVDLLGENNVRGLVPGEVLRIDPEPALLGGRLRVIQSEIPGDQVGTTVVVEVSHCETVPPAAHWRQGHRLRYVAATLSIVPVELDPHPFTHGDKIHTPVAVEIDPHRVGDHASRVSKLGTPFFGDICEVSTVIAQQISPGGKGIVSR